MGGIFHAVTLALVEYGGLLANLREMANDLLVAIIETVKGVRDADLLAELHDIFLRLSEIVARHAWVPDRLSQDEF